MRNRFLLFYTGLVFLACSCSNTKYLPAGESLYIGSKVKVKSAGKTDEKDKTVAASLNSLVRPIPNKSILGLRFKLWIYNIAGHPKKEKSLRGKLKYKVGEPPVLLSDVNQDRNVKILEANIQNQGYLQGSVSADTVVKKRRATTNFAVAAGYQYHIKNVSFDQDSSLLPKAIAMSADGSFLKPGNSYNLDQIGTERARIDGFVKERGFYYFNPDYIYVTTDSSIGNHEVNMYVNTKPIIPQPAKKSYLINNIFIFSNYRLGTGSSDTLKSNTVLYKGYSIEDRRHVYKPRMFEQMMLFSPGDMYKLSNHNLTLNRLITLGLFKFVKNRFEIAPGIDTPKLNTYYYLTPLPKKSLKFELNGSTKSNNLTGSTVSVSWRNRNTFKGGELLSISALGGFEVQYGGALKGYNTYRGGLEANLAIPRFVI